MHTFDFFVPAVGVVFLKHVGEVIPLSLIYAFVDVDAAKFHIVPSHLFRFFVGFEFLTLVVAQDVSCKNLIGFVLPSVIEHHKVTESFGNHVVEEIARHIGIISAFLAGDCGDVVAFVIDFAKSAFPVRSRRSRTADIAGER